MLRRWRIRGLSQQRCVSGQREGWRLGCPRSRGSEPGADAVQVWGVAAVRAGVERWPLVVGGRLQGRVLGRRAGVSLSLLRPECPVTVPGT